MPSIELITTVASAAGAVVSAIYAWRSTRIAKKALWIAEADHLEKHAGLNAYMIDGVAWEDKPVSELVAFSCSLSNVASTPLSIVRCDLHVHAFDATGQVCEIILQPVRSGAPGIWDLEPLLFPLNLDAKHTASGWLGYVIPERVKTSMSVDKYELVFVPSSGAKTSIVKYLLRRINNATPKD